jgi:hypothetical protein
MLEIDAGRIMSEAYHVICYHMIRLSFWLLNIFCDIFESPLVFSQIQPQVCHLCLCRIGETT